MDTQIGSTLRDARIRQKIDLSDVEQETKIRARYLRALENEEWHVLPGGAYTRSFIRTYASFLGLDGDRLADDYRRQHEDELAGRYPPAEPVLAGSGGSGRRLPRLGGGALAALISVVLIGILIVLGVMAGSDDGEGPTDPARAERGGAGAGERPDRASRVVSLRLAASGEVWVCLLDDRGTPVLNGVILAPGAEEGPFRSARFAMALGNGQIALDVNGRRIEPPDPGTPTGYVITPPRNARELDEGERPDCA